MVSSVPQNCFVTNPRLTGGIFRRPLGHFPFAFSRVLQAGGWSRTLWADLNEKASSLPAVPVNDGVAVAPVHLVY